MSSENSSLPESKLDDIYIKLLRAIENYPDFMNTTRLSEFIDRGITTTSERLSRLEKNEYIVKYDKGNNNYFDLRDHEEK